MAAFILFIPSNFPTIFVGDEPWSSVFLFFDTNGLTFL